jgi:hypothetical protein
VTITVGVVIGSRLRQYRDLRRLTVKQLADLCAPMAPSLTPAVITNIERPPGQAKSPRPVTVEELMALSLVLEVVPILLFLPLGVEPKVEFLPGQVADTWNVVRWFTGEAHLDGSDVSEDAGAAQLVLFRAHQQRVNEALEAIRRGQAIASVSSYSGPPAPSESEVLPGLSFADWPPEHRRDVDDRLRAIQSIRRESRRAGMTDLPRLPAGLKSLDPQA